MPVDGPGDHDTVVGSCCAPNRLHVAAAVGAGGPCKGLALAEPKDSGVGTAGADQHVFSGDESLTVSERKMHLSLPVDAQGRHLIDDLGGLNAEAADRGAALIEFHDQDGFAILTCDRIVQSVHLD